MTSTTPASTGKNATTMADGRQADSARRRQRVIAAINRAVSRRRPRSASPPSPAPPAVDRTFLYRHRDLLGQDPRHSRPRPPAGRRHAARPSAGHPCKPTCSPPTNAPLRLAARVQQLEKRLSEALGEQAWRESGLGAPADIDALNHKITILEQQAVDLRLQLEERDEDLAAARAANRELMAQLNATARRR